MTKIYLLKFLLFSVFALAQPKLFVGDQGKFRVSPGTLVYTGGGVKMVGSGQIDNSGNFYIKGGTSDSFITAAINSDNTSTKTTGGNFVLKINEATPAVPYGQLRIEGIPQDKITGIVDKQYKTAKHGTYQQMAFPFFEKSFNSLGSDLFGASFSNIRYSQNEVLRYDNTNVVSLSVNVGQPVNTATSSFPAAYYMVGTKNFDPSAKIHVLKGRPLADEGNVLKTGIPLVNAGKDVVFGTYGDNKNQYKERYNSYLSDGFDYSTSFDLKTGAWSGNYGKNIYQFGNPFLTNIDLSNIGHDVITDGNAIANVQGIRFEVLGVGGATSTYKFITFNTSGVPSGAYSGDDAAQTPVPIGDINGLVIKPLETFVIKLKDNTPQTLYFNQLRRFSQVARGPSALTAPTSTSAANEKFGAATATTASVSGGTVKQLGIIALDKDGNELDRTYYVVYPEAKSGHNAMAKSQITAMESNIIGTFEERIEGGLDENAAQNYWLYINEANEVVSRGKEIPMYTYSDKIAKFKFEILENAVALPEGRPFLSSGESFFIKDVPADKLVRIENGQTIDVATDEFGLYYGQPETSTLDTKENIKPSLTRVVYDQYDNTFKVLFAPTWKFADVTVYDMSGRLINAENKVNANNVYTLKINPAVNTSYIIKLVSHEGEIVTRKIIR